MNRRPLLARTALLLVLAFGTPAGFVAAASPPQGPEPSPQVYTLKGHLASEGRADQQQIIHLTVRLDSKEPVITEYDLKTNENGEFSFDVGGSKGDMYTWRAKGLQTLATSGSFELGSIEFIEAGTQLTGDANNDNRVSIVDFNMVRATFSKQVGDDGYDARADFTGDSVVNIRDFNLLRGNIGKAGVEPLNP